MVATCIAILRINYNAISPTDVQTRIDSVVSQLGGRHRLIVELCCRDRTVIEFGSCDSPISKLGGCDRTVIEFGSCDSPISKLGGCDRTVSEFDSRDTAIGYRIEKLALIRDRNHTASGNARLRQRDVPGCA